MLAKLFEVRETKDRGKGLFATERVPRGTIVFFECQACRRVPKPDFELLGEDEKSFILKYGYKKSDGSHLVPCDDIIYLNHSCNANILDSGYGFDIVVRDIEQGEEATYDYRLFHDDDDLSFRCLCGNAACCKVVMCIHPPPEGLAVFWDKRVGSAMEQIAHVRQPLAGKLPK